MAGAQVALTREAGTNGSLRALLADAGVSTCIVPCIRFDAGPDLPRLAPQLREGMWEYVVLTSPHAAAVFGAEWLRAGAPDVPIASIGSGTTESLLAACAVTSAGGGGDDGGDGDGDSAAAPPLPAAAAAAAAAAAPTTSAATTTVAAAVSAAAAPVVATPAAEAARPRVTFEASRSSAAAIAAELPVLCPSGIPATAAPAAAVSRCRVLYPASRAAGRMLEDTLLARGFEVTRLDVYDTVAALWSEEEAAAAAKVRAAAFASPSAVKGWAAQCGTEVVAVCIGETTAAAARTVGFACVVVAAQAKVPALAEAVIRAVSVSRLVFSASSDG